MPNIKQKKPEEVVYTPNFANTYGKKKENNIDRAKQSSSTLLVHTKAMLQFDSIEEASKFIEENTSPKSLQEIFIARKTRNWKKSHVTF